MFSVGAVLIANSFRAELAILLLVSSDTNKTEPPWENRGRCLPTPSLLALNVNRATVNSVRGLVACLHPLQSSEGSSGLTHTVPELSTLPRSFLHWPHPIKIVVSPPVKFWNVESGGPKEGDWETRGGGVGRREGVQAGLVPLVWLYPCRRICSQNFVSVLGGR